MNHVQWRLSRCEGHLFMTSAGLEGAALFVGCVAYGWLEMTSDPDAPCLTRLPARIDERRRGHLPTGGVAERFGRDHPAPLLSLTLQDEAGHRWVHVGAVDRLWSGGGEQATQQRLSAPGWRFPWNLLPASNTCLEALETAP